MERILRRELAECEQTIRALDPVRALNDLADAIKGHQIGGAGLIVGSTLIGTARTADLVRMTRQMPKKWRAAMK